jgi:predicted CoA-substrate-specific enzyme activase
MGKKEATFVAGQATEVMCDAKGAQYLFPQVRGIIDIGAESCRVIECDQKGNVVDFVLNDKCAAGTGIFLDSMAKALEVKPEEMGELSLKSMQDVNITSMCAVFAESEVVSLIHRKVDKVDILKGIHKSIASRICGLANRLRMEGEIAVLGGVAKNIGVITSLEEILRLKLAVPPNPQIVSALGAAFIAREGVRLQ